jgi:enamine deaminase RidA (YjgF/YER057c/UK114 family)
MSGRLSRSVIEPRNSMLNVSRNANLPHSPSIRVGEYIFLSGMGPVDPGHRRTQSWTDRRADPANVEQHGAYVGVCGLRIGPY